MRTFLLLFLIWLSFWLEKLTGVNFDLPDLGWVWGFIFLTCMITDLREAIEKRG